MTKACGGFATIPILLRLLFISMHRNLRFLCSIMDDWVDDWGRSRFITLKDNNFKRQKRNQSFLPFIVGFDETL